MDEVSGQAHRRRPQVLLGCIGLVLVAAGLLAATLTARKEWTPPLEVSVIRGHAGQSVADVQLGSAGPIVADLEVTGEKKVLWSYPLSPTTALQTVDLPGSLLRPGSQVAVVSKGHTLRWVDG